MAKRMPVNTMTFERRVVRHPPDFTEKLLNNSTWGVIEKKREDDLEKFRKVVFSYDEYQEEK